MFVICGAVLLPLAASFRPAPPPYVWNPASCRTVTGLVVSMRDQYGDRTSSPIGAYSPLLAKPLGMLLPIPNAFAIWERFGSWPPSLCDCQRPPSWITWTGFVSALDCTVRVPLWTFVDCATNFTVRSRVAPGATVNGKAGGPTSSNWPVIGRPVTWSAAVPVLLIRTVPVSAIFWLPSAVVCRRLNAIWSSNGTGSALTALSTAPSTCAGTYGLTLRTRSTMSWLSNGEPGTSSVATTYAFGSTEPSAFLYG